MTTASEALKKAANSNAAQKAADAAKTARDDIGDFADDVSRKATKNYGKAKDFAAEVYEEAHDASKDYPHVTLALAAGLGFLLGVWASRR